MTRARLAVLMLLGAAGCNAPASTTAAHDLAMPLDASAQPDSSMPVDSSVAPVDLAIPPDLLPPAPTCMDGIQNGNETDVDCGGGTCSPCALAKKCLISIDCLSGACSNGMCSAGVPLTVTFGAPALLATPGAVSQFIARDVNDDGKLDLIAVYPMPGGVAVLLGNGDGTFQPALDFATAASATYVAAGDFDGDGKLDLAVTDPADEKIAILLGDGTGHFTLLGTVPVDADPIAAPDLVWAGDWNGDGKLDLLTLIAGPVAQNGQKLNLLAGDGHGGFAAATTAFSFAGDKSAILLASLNLDTTPDLVLAADDGMNDVTLTVARADGQGGFANGGGDIKIDQESVLSLAMGDLKSNHKSDLVLGVFVLGSFEVEFAFGSGGVMFGPPTNGLTLANEPLALATADFDLDGRLDVAAWGTGAGVVAFGAGDGTFGHSVDVTAAGAVPGADGNLVVGDFNGDTKPDLVLRAMGQSGLYVVLNTGM